MWNSGALEEGCLGKENFFYTSVFKYLEGNMDLAAWEGCGYSLLSI